MEDKKIIGYLEQQKINKKLGRKFVYPPYVPKEFPLIDGYQNYNKYPDFFEAIKDKYTKKLSSSKDLVELTKEGEHSGIMIKKFTLPKGTILYRGTNYDKLYNKETKYVFFGLDILISTWILAETLLKDSRNTNNKIKSIGYVHEFVLNKSIDYYYIDYPHGETLHFDQCINNIPCLKPQWVMHGTGNNRITELGTEITIPVDMVNKTYFSYKKSYTVDIMTLLEFLCSSYLYFDPTSAIINTVKLNNMTIQTSNNNRKTMIEETEYIAPMEELTDENDNDILRETQIKRAKTNDNRKTMIQEAQHIIPIRSTKRKKSNEDEQMYGIAGNSKGTLFQTGGKKDKKIKKLKNDIKMLESKIRFIVEYINGKLLINGKSESEIISILKERKFKAINDNYNYLTEMKISSLSKENIMKLKKRIDFKKEKYQKLNNILKDSDKKKQIKKNK